MITIPNPCRPVLASYTQGFVIIQGTCIMADGARLFKLKEIIGPAIAHHSPAKNKISGQPMVVMKF